MMLPWTLWTTPTISTGLAVDGPWAWTASPENMAAMTTTVTIVTTRKRLFIFYLPIIEIQRLDDQGDQKVPKRFRYFGTEFQNSRNRFCRTYLPSASRNGEITASSSARSS